jgi:hypothetical protein
MAAKSFALGFGSAALFVAGAAWLLVSEPRGAALMVDEEVPGTFLSWYRPDAAKPVTIPLPPRHLLSSIASGEDGAYALLTTGSAKESWWKLDERAAQLALVTPAPAPFTQPRPLPPPPTRDGPAPVACTGGPPIAVADGAVLRWQGGRWERFGTLPPSTGYVRDASVLDDGPLASVTRGAVMLDEDTIALIQDQAGQLGVDEVKRGGGGRVLTRSVASCTFVGALREGGGRLRVACLEGWFVVDLAGNEPPTSFAVAAWPVRQACAPTRDGGLLMAPIAERRSVLNRDYLAARLLLPFAFATAPLARRWRELSRYALGVAAGLVVLGFPVAVILLVLTAIGGAIKG